MPYCKKCGKSIKGKAQFCPNCGAPIGAATEGLGERERVKLDIELRSVSRLRKSGIVSIIVGFIFLTFGTAIVVINLEEAVQTGTESSLFNVFWVGLVGGIIMGILGAIELEYADHKEKKIKEALG